MVGEWAGFSALTATPPPGLGSVCTSLEWSPPRDRSQHSGEGWQGHSSCDLH